MRVWRAAVGLAVCGATLIPSIVSAQRAQGRAQPVRSSWWIAPYLGLGFQGAYYEGVVQFSDGSTDFLTIDPETGVLLGVQVGYRVGPKWTANANLSTSSPNAEYVEDLTPRPDVDLRTTQLEVGLLYDLATYRVSGETAPFAVGGGVSLTFHSLNRFTWDGNFVEPSTTSLGVHGLAALEIPLGPKLSFRGQGKLTFTPLSLGDLEEKIGAAESAGEPAPITARLDAGTSLYFNFLLGVSIRL